MWRSKWRALSKQQKINLLVIGCLALALPLLLFATYLQKETRTRAAEITAVNRDGLLEEDNPPPDPIAQRDTTKLISDVAKVNAIQSPKGLAGSTKPNIVVVMMDDINPMDGRMFTEAITPNIYSTFVSQGLKFNNFYVETPLCCPARANFLSGQHTQNHSVVDLDGTRFNPTQTIATELQASGYHTMLVGKYLNDFNKIPENQAIPPGWTKFDGIYAGNGKFYDYRIISKTGSGYQLTSYGHSEPDYSTDVETNIAVTRLKQADPTKPIFAFLTPYGAHGPHTPAERHRGDSRCANLSWAPASFNEPDASDKPNYIKNKPQVNSLGHSITKYCETILSIDDMVGRIKAELAAQGRLENTIFVLTADNGMSWGEHRLTAKTTPYSTHVPLFVTWPSARGTSPTDNNAVLSNIDFAPTFCEAGGCVMGPYPNGQTIADGKSFLPLLKNQSLTWTRDSILESQPVIPDNAGPADRPAWWAVRTTTTNPLGLWHYVEYDSGEKELYDLSNGPCYSWTPEKSGDPCELNNLLSPNASISDQVLTIADSFHSKLIQHKSEKGDGTGVAPSKPPCKWVNPTIRITETSKSATAGKTLNYAVFFRDNDSTSCNDRKLAITLKLPSSSWKYSPSVVTLRPGQTLTLQLAITSPTTAVPGKKSIGLTISGAINRITYLKSTIYFTVLPQ